MERNSYRRRRDADRHHKGRSIPGGAWSRWVLRRILLTRHDLPMKLELERSLEEARKQGILRAAGTRYRFQHAKIQDHLAQAARPADKVTEGPSPRAESPST
jgi:hypothetical protein